MKIYIDNDYKCHTSNDGTMREIETDAFNGKCPAYIEGYRFIPNGETWTNPQGVECSGVSPWKDYNILEAYQEQYEAMLAELEAAKADLADADAALAELSVEWGEDNG